MCNTTNPYIETPYLKNLPGIKFWHWTSPEDFDITIEIFNQERAISGIDRTKTREDLENEVKWHENFDITQQYIYVEKEGLPIAHFDFNYEEELNGPYLLFLDGGLLPEYYEKEIAQAMLDFAENELRRMTADLPADREKIFRTWWRMKNQKAIQFFLSNGYQITRYFYRMTRPIEIPLKPYPLPQGLEIRPVQPEHYRKIWDAMQEAFEDHWSYIPPSESQYQAWLTEATFQPDIWKVAWDGDQVAGMVLNFYKPEENEEFNRKRGYTEEISVRRPWRNRGLAKALIAESINLFEGMGMTETHLSVDVDNRTGALNLYTDFGYQEDSEKTTIVLDKKA